MTTLAMNRKHLYGILIYFSIIFLIGIIGFIVIFCLSIEAQGDFIVLSLMGGISSALVGSTIFYIRKIYKGCINKNITEKNNEDFEGIGVILYFVFRPIFSIAFSCLVLLCMRMCVSYISFSESLFNKNYIYLGMFISFMAGFASGDVITYLENKSKTIIPEAFKS